MKDEKINKIILEIDKESKKIKTIKDFIDFSFNFKIDGFGFTPLQNKEELRTFLEICSMKKPKTVIEIGTAAGGTLFLLTRVLSNDAKIVSIDLPGGNFGGELFQDWKKPIYKSFAKNDQQIFLIREDSQKKETLDKVKDLVGDKIDLLLIDGDHTYAGVRNDFELYSQIVAEDGIIVFHDINQEFENVEVWKLWNEVKSEHETFELCTLGKGKGFGIGIIYHKPSKEKFVNFLKKLIQEKDRRIEILKDNPIGMILDFYNDRDDLQIAFPEVKGGVFDNLIKWVVNNHTTQSKEHDAMRILSNFHYWYEEYYNNLILKTERDDLLGKIKILEGSVNEKDEGLRRLESTVNEKDEGLRRLESTVNEKDEGLRRLESTVNEKDEGLRRLESTVNEKDEGLRRLESTVNEKDEGLRRLESTVNEKDEGLRRLESTVNEKDEGLRRLESTVNEKDEGLRRLESTVNEKDEGLRRLESTVNEKDDHLLNTNQELSERISELKTIKNSKMFKFTRKMSRQIDKIFSKSGKSNELKKIINSSAHLIKNEGIKNYSVAVGEKLAKKEFRISPPFEIPEDKDSELIDLVKNNKKSRLKIKSHNKEEIENDQIYINDDLVDLK